VGMSGQDVSVGSTTSLVLSKKHVMGHLGYKNADIETLVDLVSRGRLDLSRSVSEIVPLEDVAKGIEKLHNHEGNPIRILVQP